MIKIGISGISGRMGKAVFEEIQKDPNCEVVFGCLRQKDLPYLIPEDSSLQLVQNPEDYEGEIDLVIDFALPGFFSKLVTYCVEHKIPLVSGTTGLSKHDHQMMEKASQSIPILYDTNMSIGMTLLKSFVEMAARHLDADYDVEIQETHHRYKKDAPSGSAISLGQAVTKGRGLPLESLRPHAHVSGKERESGTIGFSVQRGGNVVGEHSVRFLGEFEEITFAHRSFDRSVYAKGAFKAVKWLQGQEPGLYHMKDVVKI